jgi:hypothetical protein
VEKYGELLEIGGGKERMLHYFTVRTSNASSNACQSSYLFAPHANQTFVALAPCGLQECEDVEPFKSIIVRQNAASCCGVATDASASEAYD